MFACPTVSRVSALSALPPVVPSYGALRAVADAARARAEEQRSTALAIVVATAGPVQRVRGSMALLDGNGICAGTLTGGALEGQLEHAAQRVFEDGRAHAVTIDVGEETAAEAHTNGDHRHTVQVLILPLPVEASALRDAIVSACASSAWLRLRLGLARDEMDRRDLGRGEARTGAHVFAFDDGGHPCAAPLTFDRHVSLAFAPPPRVVLLGAGPESTALSRIARLLGWYVEVVEVRARGLSQIDAVSVDRVHRIGTDDLPALIAGSHFDAAIVGSHDFQIDAAYLRHLAAAGMGYIGLLGSPERRDALLGTLGDIVATQLEPRLYAPAGLRLGGEGPESTALSIIAQLQNYLTHDAHA